MFQYLNFENLQNKKVSKTTDIDYSLLEDSDFDIKIFDIDSNNESKIFDLIYVILTKNMNVIFKKIEVDEVNNKIYFYFNGDFHEPDFIEMRTKSTDHHFSKLINLNTEKEDLYSLKEIISAINLYSTNYKEIFNRIKYSFEEDTKAFEFVLKNIDVKKIKIDSSYKTTIVFSVMRNVFIPGKGLEKKWFHSDYLFDADTKQFLKEDVREDDAFHKTCYDICNKHEQIVPYFYKYIDEITDIYKKDCVKEFLDLNIDLSENFYLNIKTALFKSDSVLDKNYASLNYLRTNSSSLAINPSRKTNHKIIYDLTNNSFFTESLDYSFNKNIIDFGGPEAFFDKIYINKNILDEKFYEYLPNKGNCQSSNKCQKEIFKENLEKKSFMKKIFSFKNKIKKEK